MRNWVRRLFLAFSITLFLTGSIRAQVFINELMASNASTLEDPDEAGGFDDWFELYNAGATPVDLGNKYLTDNLNEPTHWQIPAGVAIAAGEFLLFWADSDEEQGDNHTNFRLGAGGEALGLFDADGTTLIDSVTFGQQTTDISFGRFPDAGERWCVMGMPTPGAPNGVCESGSVEFSRRGGTFSASFQLELKTDSPTAEIYYTTNGDEPDDQTGSLYTEPITVTETTWVRARVYEPGFLPGPIVSEVFLALDADLVDFESNLPLVLIDSAGVNINSGRIFRPISIVVIETGETERAQITDEPDFAGRAGIHIRGASTTQYPKKQYRMEFWDEYQEDRQVSLLGFPEEADWILQAPYSDKTLMRNYQMYTWSREAGRYAVRTRFAEVFIQRSGEPKISRSDYVGVYVFMESVKRDNQRVDIRRLEPSDNSEPEITGGYLLKKDWLDAGDESFSTKIYRDNLIYVDPKPEEITAEQRAWIKAYFDEFEEVHSGANFDDPVNGYAKYIDMDSFADHQILVELGRNVDGYVLSTYLFKDRGGKVHMGPIWDYNGALGGAEYFNTFMTDGWHFDFPGFPEDNPNGYHWYERLWDDPAYLKRLAERWFDLRKEVFKTDKMLQDIDDNVALLTDDGASDNAVKRNFERWPVLDTYVWPNYRETVSGTYEEHVGWMKTWLTGRLDWMDEAMAGLGGVLRPQFSHPGGPVEEGLKITITADEGEIYYTLNGPDPREVDNSVAPEASLYSGEPIAITENTRLQARAVVDGRLWSNLTEAVYATDVVPIVVTELMYDPPRFPEDTARFRTSYEFLELQNIGDETIDLSGVRYVHPDDPDNPRFNFSSGDVRQLAPGEYVVIARNVEAFRERYGSGPQLAGAYDGSLSNSGDAIRILGPVDETILDFEYSETWHPSTAGEGHSLVIRDPRAPRESWGQAESWRPSLEIGGSPGRADSEPPPGGLQLRGDITQDSRLNLTDGVALLRAFVGLASFPCATDAANRELMDTNEDDNVDISDAIHILTYLFLSAEPHALSPDCVSIVDCPTACE